MITPARLEELLRTHGRNRLYDACGCICTMEKPCITGELLAVVCRLVSAGARHGKSQDWWDGVKAVADAVSATASDEFNDDVEESIGRLVDLLQAVWDEKDPETWKDFAAPSSEAETENEDD